MSFPMAWFWAMATMMEIGFIWIEGIDGFEEFEMFEEFKKFEEFEMFKSFEELQVPERSRRAAFRD